MIPGFVIPVFLLCGFSIGMAVGAMTMATPAHDKQFKKDCVQMLHGSVPKDAHSICVVNGRILAHA
jgi:hypothetical protein